MKNIQPQKIIHSEEFILEPVNLVCKELQKLMAKKIILNSGRGTGKSTVLYQLQNRTIDTEMPFICMKFNSVGLFIQKNETFPRAFFEHYWEELFVSQLLYYIESYYEKTYYNNFREYGTFLQESSNNTIDYINNSVIGTVKPLERLLQTKEVTGEILDKLKQILSIEQVGLCIDRFDWINNSDALAQQILSGYFSMFQKVIITSDDENLRDYYHKKESALPFYKIYDNISYGENHIFVKLLLLNRIKVYNQSLSEIDPNLRFPTDWIDDALSLLIKGTNGNILQLLEILNQLFYSWNFNKKITTDLIEREIEESKEYIRKLRKISTPPKFHL